MSTVLLSNGEGTGDGEREGRESGREKMVKGYKLVNPADGDVGVRCVNLPSSLCRFAISKDKKLGVK